MSKASVESHLNWLGIKFVLWISPRSKKVQKLFLCSIKRVLPWRKDLLHLAFLDLFSLMLLKYPYFQNYFWCNFQIWIDNNHNSMSNKLLCTKSEGINVLYLIQCHYFAANNQHVLKTLSMHTPLTDPS